MTYNTPALLQQADGLLENGMLQQAIALYSEICRNDPAASDAWLMLGMIYADSGSFSEAIRHLSKCLEIEPGTLDAQYSLARIYLLLKNEDQAYTHTVQATRDESYTEAWLLRSVLSAKRGEHAESEVCAVKVVQQTPLEIEGYVNLAHAQIELKKLVEARGTLESALRISPDRTDAIHMHAHVCELMGELPEADASYKKLINTRSMEHIGHLGVSKIRMNYGDASDAEFHVNTALKFKPDFAEANFHYAEMLNLLGRHEEALPLYEKAATLAPDNMFILERYADAQQGLGQIKESLELYDRSLRSSESVSARVKKAIVMPVIMESSDQIKDSRHALLENVRYLRERKLRIANPAANIGRLPFYTVYHGLNDLEINRTLADFYLESAPELGYVASHVDANRANKSKIVIRFISRFFCTHTIGQVMKGIIKLLSRERFEVVLLTFPYGDDVLAAEINASADRVVFLPNDWQKAHELIASQKLDILFYTDIGMEPYTYFLAYSRLAPVQCTTWGHAVTTGIPNIDYYLTCDTFEPQGADSHYSEKLVRLSAAPTFYPKPSLTQSDAAQTLPGWDETKNTYLCPQVLFKLHPDFDEMLGGILREDPNGEIILLECRHQAWLDLLMHRLNKSLPDVANRIKVLPYPGSAGYLRLIETCDVMLDTYHYGGGSTSLQGLGLGTPIVTLPGDFQRGRHTYSYYASMDMMNCVAGNKEEYVQMATRIGKDKDYRNTLSEQIKDRNEILFSDLRVIKELEDFFVESINFLN